MESSLDLDLELALELDQELACCRQRGTHLLDSDLESSLDLDLESALDLDPKGAWQNQGGVGSLPAALDLDLSSWDLDVEASLDLGAVRRQQLETQDAKVVHDAEMSGAEWSQQMEMAGVCDDEGQADSRSKGLKGSGRDKVGKGTEKHFAKSLKSKTKKPSHPTLAVLPAAVVKGPEHTRHQDVGYPGTSAMPCSRTAPLDALVLEVEGRTRQFGTLRGLNPYCEPPFLEAGGRRPGKGGRERGP